MSVCVFFFAMQTIDLYINVAGPKHGLPVHAEHMNILTNRKSEFEAGKQLHVALLLVCVCVAQNVTCGPSMKHSTEKHSILSKIPQDQSTPSISAISVMHKRFEKLWTKP